MTNFSKSISAYMLKGSWLVALAIFLSSCLVDERSYNREEEIILQGEEIEVLLPLQLPSSLQAVTKGLTTDQENHVDILHVLVFDSTDDKYLYSAMTSQIEDNGTSQNKKAKLKLIYGASENNRYDLVFLTNAKEIIDSIGGMANHYKNEILEKLVYDLYTQTNRRLITPGSQTSKPFTPLIMWGEHKNVTLTPGDNTLTGVSLVWMLAKVNVTVALEATSDKFELTSVHVYNAMDKGYIAPLSGWDTDNPLNNVKPCIPADAAPLEEALIYKDSDINEGNCHNEIYLFEAKKGNADSLEFNTCLVIGGIYDNKETYYYRLDFIVDSTSQYMPLLRSNSYEIKIKNVTGIGYKTPKDAFNAAPVNMKAKILSWSDIGMNDIFFDGQYYLTRNSGEFKLSREARVEKTGSMEDDWDISNILELQTDSPFGWKVDSIVWNNGGSIKRDSVETITGEWLNPHLWRGEKDKKAIVQLLVTFNESKVTREGEIHISAGRISFTVKVTQTDQTNLGLSIIDEEGNEITEIVFPSGRATAYPIDKEQGFIVRWAPNDQKLITGTTGYGDESLEFDITCTYYVKDEELPPTGNFTYSFKPTVLGPEYDGKMEQNPFFERGRRADFMVSNGSDNLTRSVYIRQINYGVRVEKEGAYPLDGNTHALKVYANAPWTIKLKEGVTQKVIQGEVNGRGVADTQYGSNIEFRTVNDMENPSIFADYATLVVESINGEFDPVEIVVYCTTGSLGKPSNSYILKPGNNGVLIPVSRIHEHAPDFDNFTPYHVKLVWQDKPGVIKLLRTAGSGKNGYIFVQPGDVEGNAVVAATTSDGSKILWSWHIWVADYDPKAEATFLTNHTFMSRNLGALTSSRTHDSDRYGLLYQWGRKDPFPNSNSVVPLSSNQPSGDEILDEIPIYNLEGQEISVGPDIATLTTIEESIQYPLRFGLSWLGSESDYTELWNKDGKKTIYDPCPEGWRIPADEAFGLGGTIGTITGSPGIGMTLTYPQGTEGVFFPFTPTRRHTNGSLILTPISGSASNTRSNYTYYWIGRTGSERISNTYYHNIPFALTVRVIYSLTPFPYKYQIDGFSHGSLTLHNVGNGYVVRCIEE